MGKLERFLLSFDNELATYYAGQVVTGQVKVKLKAPMTMRGIYLKLEGKAYVQWTDKLRKRPSRGKRGKVVRRSATEIYFDLKQCMWGKGTKETLAAGEYEFPFTMTLPLNLPTSFEGTHGHVRYQCQANIDCPWKFDPKCKAAFTVLSIVDLNVIPDSSRPVSKENSAELGSCCFMSGSLLATAAINKLGFVPGENLLVNATIENNSSKIINKSTVTLMSRIMYSAQHHGRIEGKAVCQLERGPIAAFSHDEWVNKPIKVPPLPPSGGCQLINVEYYLLFSVDPSGTNFDLRIELPVIIGTIPLRMDFAHFHAASTNHFNYGQQPAAASSSSVLPPMFDPQKPTAPTPIASPDPSAPPIYESLMKETYPDLPPPSYEECVYGTVNIKEEEGDEHTGGQLDYAPRYAYYNMN